MEEAVTAEETAVATAAVETAAVATAAVATAAAAVSQELSPFGWTLGASRPGTKYPVRGIPHFD